MPDAAGALAEGSCWPLPPRGNRGADADADTVEERGDAVGNRGADADAETVEEAGEATGKYC